MGKASRRRSRSARPGPGAAPVPFVARPFAGLPAETEWVALRELLPAATAQVVLRPDAADPAPAAATAPATAPPTRPPTRPPTATVTTVLPLAWPAVRRGGDVLVATQSGATSGDPSRDIAAALMLALDAEDGTAVASIPTVTADTPRLQDVLDLTAPFEVTLHGRFDYWVGDAELDAEAAASLERANESVVPTERVPGATSAYWCLINGRSFLRWVLPYDEDAATTALARLHAAGEDRLTPGSRLLGAFRAAGLLVPVWEVPDDVRAPDLEGPAATTGRALAEAAADERPLDPSERRARAGLLNRQVTLR